MLAEQTIEKLHEMNLSGMARSFSERRSRPDHREMSYEDFVGFLVEDEYLYRQNKRLTRLLQQARLKIASACLEDLDYRQPRGLLKAEVVCLQNTTWLEQHQNILITGPTGVGKSYLACAFGQWACRQGYAVLYYRWPRLLGDMLAAKGEGGYLKYLRKLAKVHLLILDDFGLNTMTETDRKDFLEIVEDRYMAGATLITSQLPLKNWHEYIGEATLADAICDRLFHVAHSFELKGGSMRKKMKKMD